MQWQRVKNQYLAAAIGSLKHVISNVNWKCFGLSFFFCLQTPVNLATIGFGLFEGWSSPILLLLTSDQTPLPSGKITMEEASWVASLQSVGCLFGNILFGYIINKFGRRLPLILIVFPLVVRILNWYSRINANANSTIIHLDIPLAHLVRPKFVYVVCGPLVGWLLQWWRRLRHRGKICASSWVAVRLQSKLPRLINQFRNQPIFIAEISDDRIRGFLTSTHVLTENIGILLGYVIGGFFDYYAIPLVSIIIAIASGILIYFLPETPLFNVKQNKIEVRSFSLSSTEKPSNFWKCFVFCLCRWLNARFDFIRI